MLSCIRRYRFIRLFWGLMAFHLFNISVDAPDLPTHDAGENLAYNDMESVSEFFLEEMLCIEDAVPECEDPDREDDSGTFGKTLLVLGMPEPGLFPWLPMPAGELRRSPTRTNTHRNGYSPDIVPPPPEA